MHRKSIDKIFNNDASYIWIYGKHGVFSVLENANRKIYEIIYNKKLSIYEKEISSRLKKINLAIEPKKVDKKEIDRIFFEKKKHQGIVVRCSRLIIPSYEKIFEKSESSKLNIGLILDNITDINNIGAIYRNSFAFNIDFIISETRNSPLENNSLINSACGCYDKIRSYKTKNINLAIKILKANNWWIIGLDHKGDLNLKDFIKNKKYNSKIIFILGSEGRGIRELIKKNCDSIINIETNKNSQSINVSSATAILLYNINNYLLKH